ncbi:MAG TPA: YIP1 family protein [Longimicrobiales bacterium]
MNDGTLSSVEPPAGTDAAEAAYTFPWPPPAEESPLTAFFRTWRDSLFSPARFFRAMPEAGSGGAALLYFLIIGVIAAAFGLFWQMLFRMALGAAPRMLPQLAALGAQSEPWSPLIGFLLSPLFLLIEIGIAFVVIHVLLYILGGARRGAGTTFRVLCFAYGPMVFTLIPGLGGFAGGIWMLVLAIIGLREAHRTDAWRAAVAVLVPVALALMLVVVMAIVATVAAVQLM